ncbi:MAG: spermidine/putrescine ABC transporter substrate-binding protein [bacterium]
MRNNQQQTNSKKFLFLVVGVSIFLVLCFCIFLFQQRPQDSINSSEEKILRIYDWENYFSPETLANFEKETGITVDLTTFVNEDEVLAAVQSDPSQYDLVLSSDSNIELLLYMKLVTLLDRKKIPNLKNFDESVLAHVDTLVGEYTVPYLWGTTGILVNTEKIPDYSKSWDLLWDDRYSGKLAMLDDSWEVIGAGLKSLHYPLVPDNDEQLNQAWQKLSKQRPLLYDYVPSLDLEELFVDGSVWAAQVYNGDAQEFIAKHPDLHLTYFIPDEGSSLWIDSFFIPIAAKHKNNAYLFLDYLLRPDVGADFASYLKYATPNKAAKQLESDMARLEYFDNTKVNHMLYNKIWSDIRFFSL